MKIYWWQGGLHFEPENNDDRDALMCLWSAEKIIPLKAQESAHTEGSTSMLIEQSHDSVAASK
jgi:hypothetical protein